MSENSVVFAERTGSWLTLWLNRPESRNALSEDMVAALVGVLTNAREDRSLRGITLRGKGNTFCAGGDLKSFGKLASGSLSASEVADFNLSAGRLFHLVETMPQVVLVLVEGAAMAGGLGLACAGDVVAVTRDARFALTETMIGIPPAQIAPIVVSRVGLATARRIMLTGTRFDGSEAARIGVADHVAEDSSGLDAFEISIREGVMRCAPGANAATKEILMAASRLGREELMHFAADHFARCLLSDEGREGVASFMEKRKPAWANPA